MSARFNPGRRALCLGAPALLALGLSACDADGARSRGKLDKRVARDFGIPASQPPSIAAIEKDGRGFTVGHAAASYEVFIFFDPKSQNWTNLWGEIQELTSLAKFTWLPVAVRGVGSATYGAAILDAEDRPAAMADLASKLVIARKSGMRIQEPLHESGSAQRLADVARNTQLFQSFSADGVPYLLMEASDGTLMTQTGGLSAQKLATALRLEPPKP